MYFRSTPEYEDIQNHHVADPEEAVVVESNDKAGEAAPQRQRKAFDRFGVLTGEWWNLFENANVAKGDGEPKTYQEAVHHDKSEQWNKAIQDEMNSLIENKTWDIVERPPGQT